MRVHPERIQILREAAQGPGPVVYWMSRDQRAEHNWALIQAQDLARKTGAPIFVVFCLVSAFPRATLRAYDFMLRGLEETAKLLDKRNIPFFFLRGEPGAEVSAFVTRVQAGALVTDFDPLRLKRAWQAEVTSQVSSPVFCVDAHNVIPCWAVSDKREYAARTIRPKIHRRAAEFLTPFPNLETQASMEAGDPFSAEAVLAGLDCEREVEPVSGIRPGPGSGSERLEEFLARGLAGYDRNRNDPNKDGQSRLSPFLHFGQISAQEVARRVTERKGVPSADREAFLEELIVRRELSDNFCLHCRDYDSLVGLPDWGRATLDKHRRDPRPYLYSRDELERAVTHDPLWNAAQRQMVQTGVMHGYLRMYWAKKILEWTATPEEAVKTAVDLNDRFELDGRDPNGYVGVLWSMGGLHDRPWKERSIFGTVRYMSQAGCRRKFDVDAYIRRFGG
ncbi:MAG: deoxyribodipyrimidine photo-lyase [Deltaproteobacteria bacterium]|nr:deoxyribodipyrimidine photo-lyase [Deltaproteobacteria bacterium]